MATAALNQAVDKANELGIQLIVAGDIHDQKANLRGECVKAMLDCLDRAAIMPIVIVANHDRINEKSTEHSLEFLRNTCRVVAYPEYDADLGLYLIPYHHDPEELKAYLQTLPKGSTLIMHQGVQGSMMGDYVIDKSALPKECFQDFRTILGHYHARQDIVCGKPTFVSPYQGVASYIGSPYSMSYGEANDPPKGFRVLMDDGSLEFVPTNLREHKIWETTATSDERYPGRALRADDLLWVKVKGSKEALLKVTKDTIRNRARIPGDFRLDLIPTDSDAQLPAEAKKDLTQGDLLDSLIEDLSASDERKAALKELWRKCVSG